MKIAVRGGHNFQAKGASALIDETIEDRKVKDSVILNLRKEGHEVLDVTPGNCDVNTDLRYGVNKAEEWGADLFISIHFDKAYDSYNGALGTGTWICGAGGQAEVYARRIVNSIANGTGLRNRGVKTNPKLYELRKTSMPAVIIEVCFCEATTDVSIYKAKGSNLIGELIAEGICNKDIQTDNIPSQTQSSVSLDGFYESSETKTNATIVGEGRISVLNKNCEPIPNRYIDSLDRIFVLGIYPSLKFIEIVYPGSEKMYHAYIDIENYNRISFDYHFGYHNDNGDTYVWWNSDDVNKKEPDEILLPNYKASPMYRTNGWLRITFYRADGNPSDGYVRYEGEQKERFYRKGKVINVRTSLTVRKGPGINYDNIGSLDPNENMSILEQVEGWYYIEYNTNHAKKRGYVSSKYVEEV
ncbi:TPA: SH3 domain-containing protein [Clostridium perfringens]|nr:SH3 domain-containing protein [Clostridium perfringens]